VGSIKINQKKHPDEFSYNKLLIYLIKEE
jgi:hypothetical protein